MLALLHRNNKDLASYLNVNPQTVSSWVTNSRQPRIDELYAIAAFLRIDPCELLA